MRSFSKSVLLVANQPWQIRIFLTFIKECLTKDAQTKFWIAISDYYTFIHQRELLSELTECGINYFSMEEMYLRWQQKNEPIIAESEVIFFEDYFGGKASLEILEKTNPWIFGDERNSYYYDLSENWKKRIFFDTLNWCISLVSELDPSIIISIERSTLPNNAFFAVSRIRGIPHRCLIPARLDNYWYARDDFGRGMSPDLLAAIREMPSDSASVKLAEEWMSTFCESNSGAYKSVEEELIHKLYTQESAKVSIFLKDLYFWFRKAYARTKERNHLNFKIIRLEQNLVRLTYFELREIFLKFLYAKKLWQPFSSEEYLGGYYLWALHARPEGSVLALNSGQDEIEQLEEVAKLLPVGVKILVKENIEMLGLRKRNFYSSISKNPRIILLRPESNLFGLLPESMGVLGISGTFLLESAIYGKPVFALGLPEFKGILSNEESDDVEEFFKSVEDGKLPSRELARNYVSYIFENAIDLEYKLFDNKMYEKKSPMIRLLLSLL